MKKALLITFLTCAMSVIPVVSHATNALEQLIDPSIRSANTDCGSPYTTDPNYNPSFCGCFSSAIVNGCKSQPVHPKCDAKSIKGYMKEIYNDNYSVICTKFPPAGVDSKVCVTDLSYWDHNCPV